MSECKLHLMQQEHIIVYIGEVFYNTKNSKNMMSYENVNPFDHFMKPLSALKRFIVQT